MKQLVQSVRSGDLRLLDVPPPQVSPTQVLVSTSRSLMSPGTERAVRQLASASLLDKARARPDLVRQVLKRARTEGLRSTAKAVQSRLDEEMPMGYSAAGTVAEVGEAVSGLRVGDRVATGGAGHAELQLVNGLLAVPVPDVLDDDSAAFATLGAIALHGLRLAGVGPGARVAVIGLGLVGQLATRLAGAAGCAVVGVDVRDWPVSRVQADLATIEEGERTTARILDWSDGGVDTVLLTASTAASEPVRRAAAIVRDRGSIVVIGDVGMELDRRPLYEKELTVRVARSYGPGRYEPAYEDLAIDYPPGQVRWTEGRNLEAVLGLIARGGLRVDDLITHRFKFADSLQAYELLESGAEPYLGVEFDYDQPRVDRASSIPVTSPVSNGSGVGMIGAGAFARTVLVPALQAAGFSRFVSVSSASGLSAVRLAERTGFETAVASPEAVINDPNVDAVVIATPHDTHARLAAEALRAGKHVFCEKPIALTGEELTDVRDASVSSARQLTVGFNRRHSPAVNEALRGLGVGGPLVITYRISAGPVSPGHWYGDRRQGGRLLGEVCHFIDTCAALVGTEIVRAHAFGGRDSESLMASDVVVALSFADGSVAAITYASDGHSSTPKERIEVLGRGRTVVIDDFRSVSVDAKQVWSGAQDKGHRALVTTFSSIVQSGRPDVDATSQALASMAATIAAAGSLATGAAIDPRLVG